MLWNVINTQPQQGKQLFISRDILQLSMQLGCLHYPPPAFTSVARRLYWPNGCLHAYAVSVWSSLLMSVLIWQILNTTKPCTDPELITSHLYHGRLNPLWSLSLFQLHQDELSSGPWILASVLLGDNGQSILISGVSWRQIVMAI